jgi:hypothetical protein
MLGDVVRHVARLARITALKYIPSVCGDGWHHHHVPELRAEFAQQMIVTKRQGFSTVEVRGLGETA